MKVPARKAFARFTVLLSVTLLSLLSGHSRAGEIKPTEVKPADVKAEPKAAPTKSAAKVCYYRDVRPILQANCQGCHQPAKSKGGYVMTDFKKLLAGGDSEGAAVVPKHPDQSAMLKMITPKDGEIRMPKGKNPLLDSEVAVIQKWIEQGAEDDTPADAQKHYDAAHLPSYTRPPVISSIDFSPDGKLLAVAGFHEVLLYETQKAALEARLIGLSERIQSLRFSPDGNWLAVDRKSTRLNSS